MSNKLFNVPNLNGHTENRLESHLPDTENNKGKKRKVTIAD